MVCFNNNHDHIPTATTFSFIQRQWFSNLHQGNWSSPNFNFLVPKSSQHSYETFLFALEGADEHCRAEMSRHKCISSNYEIIFCTFLVESGSLWTRFVRMHLVKIPWLFTVNSVLAVSVSVTIFISFNLTLCMSVWMIQIHNILTLWITARLREVRCVASNGATPALLSF